MSITDELSAKWGMMRHLLQTPEGFKEITEAEAKALNFSPGPVMPPLPNPEPDLTAIRAQIFFAAEAKALRTPHFGERQKEWMVQLLKRATEAGLYQPESP